jgi:uncharacterized repeat protein (TIGR03803 family)
MRTRAVVSMLGCCLIALFITMICSSVAQAAIEETVLYSFAGGASDGMLPVGGLVADASGNLYGTTGAGGGYGNCSPFGETCGVVFELAPGGNNSWTETVLYTFTGGQDGGEPLAGLTIDSKGNLYGTTAVGGEHGLGTVFEVSPNGDGSWMESVLYSFSGGSDGAYPQSTPAIRNGVIYGMTYAGGGNSCLGAPSGCGVIYQLAPGQSGWTESVLYRFTNGADGAFPYANLVFDPYGNLYGTTTQGGYLQGNCAPYGCGNVFQLFHSKSGWTLNTLHSFTYNTDGSSPFGGLLFDSKGNLYGTASGGGGGYSGTVFELEYAGKGTGSGSWSFNLLYSFSGPDGQAPESGLVSRGNMFFGTTYGGGSGSGCLFGAPCGTVFMLTGSGKRWKETVLHSFSANGDGVNPESGVIVGKNALYGTAYAGGLYGDGAIYAITP